MILDDIRDELFKIQDIEYRDFNSKFIPTVKKEDMIGVRTPELRKYAKKLLKEEGVEDFLHSLPHKYFDENQLHAFIISEIKDFKFCIEELINFLPYLDNWATCDQLSPKIFKKHRNDLLPHIYEWLKSDKTYTVRFGIGMLMEHFLDEDFKTEYPEMVAAVRSEEYYINMMTAWYFATALAKQYESILPFIEGNKLDTWTHNKSIQKAIESNRISAEQKNYLKVLKIKK